MYYYIKYIIAGLFAGLIFHFITTSCVRAQELEETQIAKLCIVPNSGQFVVFEDTTIMLTVAACDGTPVTWTLTREALIKALEESNEIET